LSQYTRACLLHDIKFPYLDERCRFVLKGCRADAFNNLIFSSIEAFDHQILLCFFPCFCSTMIEVFYGIVYPAPKY